MGGTVSGASHTDTNGTASWREADVVPRRPVAHGHSAAPTAARYAGGASLLLKHPVEHQVLADARREDVVAQAARGFGLHVKAQELEAVLHVAGAVRGRDADVHHALAVAAHLHSGHHLHVRRHGHRAWKLLRGGVEVRQELVAEQAGLRL
eukprot:CAMPEP_0114262688 /NCGR_PEP_ID=MMETSP0058-20121206/21973_1 /TAXON_ID=36894 /ORGANISM="Pyramimonas parkeae, CCMP726" /LENGTH=150 /DNA_ID=CAMNT_0001378645 /DNA_START=230 /DNA_END=682 /DNA_ORIENTATION=+